MGVTGWFLRGHATVALVVAALFGSGRVALRLVRVRGWEPADRLALALGAGFAAAGAGWLGLGLAGLWFPAVAVPPVLAGAWLARPARHTRRRPPARAPWPWLDRGLALAPAAAVGCALAAALRVDTSADAMNCHLGLLNLYLVSHRIVGLPANWYGSLPHAAVMVYGWLALLGSDPAVRAWRPWLLAAVFALLTRLGIRGGSRTAGLAAAGLIAALPVVRQYGPATFVEFEATALGLCAVLAIGPTRRPGAGRGALAGALLGAGGAVKAQAGLLAPGLLLAAGGRGAAALALFALPALVPWWVRNVLVMGGPFHPLPAWGSFRPLPPARAAVLVAHLTAYVPTTAGGWLAWPERLVRGFNDESKLGALFPAAMAALAGGVTAAGRRLLLVALPGGGAWALLTTNVRYALPLLGPLALAAAGAPAVAGPRRRWLMAAWAAAALVAQAPSVAGAARSAAALLGGREGPRDAWAVAGRNSYAALAAAADRELPPGARLLLAGECRGAWWPRPASFSSQYDEGELEAILTAGGGARRAAIRLRQRGGLVYVDDPEAAYVGLVRGFPGLAPGPAATGLGREVWARWMDVALRAGDAVLYRVRRRAGPGGAAVPLALDPGRLRAEFAPPPRVSWQ